MIIYYISHILNLIIFKILYSFGGASEHMVTLHFVIQAFSIQVILAEYYCPDDADPSSS